MLLFVCLILALLCIGLGLRVYTVERSLRAAARQLMELETVGGTSRLLLAVPNTSAEALISAVNTLLDLHLRDEADFHARESALRQQISNVSHDLRTPLTSILGYLQLLQDERLTAEERTEYLGVVESRAKTLQSLITSFYDLSRLEAGEYTMVRERVDLVPSLSSLLASFYSDFTEAGFQVSVDLPARLPPVLADPAGVLRVFTNLIRNALDHGQGYLGVRLYQEGDRIISSFSNGGAGLDHDDVIHVFDRFFTSDKMRTGRNTGLGLAIVKALTLQMGHHVEAQLENGLFTIQISWKCG